MGKVRFRFCSGRNVFMKKTVIVPFSRLFPHGGTKTPPVKTLNIPGDRPSSSYVTTDDQRTELFSLQLLKIIILLKSYYFREIEESDRIGSRKYSEKIYTRQTNRGNIFTHRGKPTFFRTGYGLKKPSSAQPLTFIT